MLLLFVGGFVALGFATGISRWPNLLASLAYQHNLVFGTGSLVNPPAWSLEIEVQFYLLAPFLAVVFSVRNALARRAIFVGTMLALPWLRGFVPPDVVERYGLSLPGFLEFFAAGFLLADLFLADWKEAPAHTWGWDVLSLVGWPSLVALMLSERAPALIAPMVLVAYIGAFRGRLSNWLFSRPLLTVIGGMCYSMYLLHYSVISVTGRLANRFSLGSSFTSRFAIEALVGLPAVLVATALFFVFLERPCMDPGWPAKLVRRFGRKTVESRDVA
jgi:peptidoglycan/LPS O-acetylase OafA/YrhL